MRRRKSKAERPEPADGEEPALVDDAATPARRFSRVATSLGVAVVAVAAYFVWQASAVRRAVVDAPTTAADGAQSAVRQSAGVESSTWDYEQTALTANLTTQLFHNHVAYERFTPNGPIALLPSFT